MIRHTLKLEAIGDDQVEYNKLAMWIGNQIHPFVGGLLNAKPRRPWVAKITGLCPRWGLRREFVRGCKDYSEANSVGSRGVYFYYHLEDGIYEIKELTAWKNERRYLIRVAGGEAFEVDIEYVEAVYGKRT